MFDIPETPKTNIKTLTDFLGVDYTSALPKENRASHMVNMINNNGYLETRPGYSQIGDTFEVNTYDAYVAETTYDVDDVVYYGTKDYKCILESTGNLPTNITYWEVLNDPLDKTPLQINGVWNMDTTTNVFLVHAGTTLYLTDDAFENATILKTGLEDAISKALLINEKLYIFDGKRVIVYGYFSAWESKYLDEIGYVPTIVVARNPDGTGGTTYEEINLVQKYRINSFLSDGVSNVYHLSEVSIDNEEPTATILVDGEIQTLAIDSFDKDAGTVTFELVPPSSSVDGQDNVFIRYAKTSAETISYINKCKIITSYGYDGNNNRLFVTGNSDYPNIDWFSYPDDGSYFPSNNFTKIGFEPIINYITLNDGSLGIQKNISDTDMTIYYRKSALLDNVEVFPISRGVKNIGCISSNANGNLLNDPLTLTNEGVFSIISSDRDEKFAMERSYFIKKKLLAELNLKNAISIVYENKYYLAINDHVYVADARYKSSIRHSYTDDFQYEWYYWENVPVRIWFEYENELYFGTEDGKIVKFNTTCLDFEVPIACLFETAFLDLGSVSMAKTVKRVTVISNPDVDINYTLGYETNEGETDIITKSYDADDFPKTLQENENIRRFMFIKFYLTNNTSKKMNFCQISLDYKYTGRYRGE